MPFAFIQDLCESKLIPSRTSLKQWDAKTLAELAYLYFLGLRVLLSDPKAQHWARDYCKRTGEPNDFVSWRNSGNDLYAMLYALSADADEPDSKDHRQISPAIIRDWLRRISMHEDESKTHRLFARLDSMFHITDSRMRSLRRIVSDWDDVDEPEKRDTVEQLIQMIHSRAFSNSELLPHPKKLDESASAGATGSSSVATVVGGLGAGFAPDETWRSVFSNSSKPKKPVLIRRGKAPK